MERQPESGTPAARWSVGMGITAVVWTLLGLKVGGTIGRMLGGEPGALAGGLLLAVAALAAAAFVLPEQLRESD